jgi:alkylation response protein AidB-like acyl-CoA dehydrogenase
MEFDWTTEQQAFYDSVVAFATRALNDDVVGRDERHEFSPAAWQACAGFGIQGLPVPVEYGGSGADALTIARAMEALGYACADNGLLFSLGAQMWSAEIPLVRFGTEEQKQVWLPGLCDGSRIGVQCMTEPATGSDAFAMTTTAERRGDTFVLNGTKTFITNAPIADMFVVFATTDRSKGIGALCALVVDRASPGVTVGTPFRKMGLRTSPMSEVTFDDCEVPAGQLLGSVGSGMAIFNTSMDWERALILATAVGSMQRQLERSVAYAKERRQFGQPIGKFQSVSHRIVDMKVRLDAARLLLYHTAWKKSQGKSTAVEASIAKMFISEAYLHSSLDTLQVHGAYGYMEESELEREVRDAIGSRIYSGTSDIQRNIVASRLGL